MLSRNRSSAPRRVTSPMAGEPGRRTFHTLDGLRGVAALAVVCFHYSTWIRPFALPSAYLAVDLFFLMSGVVVAYAYAGRLTGGLSPWRFGLIRWIRLFPLYLVGFCLGAAMTMAALLKGVAANWTWPDFTAAVAFGMWLLPAIAPTGRPHLYPLNPPVWSLFWELVINLAYAATVRWLTLRVLVLVAAPAALGLVALGWRSGTLDLGYAWSGSAVAALRVLFSFTVGVVLATLLRAGRLPRLRAPPTALLLLTAAALALPTTLGVLKDLACVLLVFPLICLAAIQNEPRRKSAYAFLGQISYPVYVTHLAFPVFRTLDAVLHRPTASLAPWSGLLTIALIVVVGWGLARFVDPPLRRTLTSLLADRPQRRALGEIQPET